MKVGHGHVVMIRNTCNCLLFMELLKGLIKLLVSGFLFLFYVFNKPLYYSDIIHGFITVSFHKI